MDNPALTSFPLPMATALLCAISAVLVWRVEFGVKRAKFMFLALFGLCAVEAFLVGLRFGYSVEALIPLQRSLPLFLGPMVYLSFASMTVGRHHFRKTAMVHLVAPILLMAAFWISTRDLQNVDWLISASYLAYLIAMFLLWKRGPDALVYARVDLAHGLSNWIIRAMGLLAFILILDSAIALDFAVNSGANASSLISFGTVPLIIVLLVFIVTLPLIITRPRTHTQFVSTPDADDAEIEVKLRQLMTEEQLFLDPFLTVQRLAKRLHLPARNLSAAINKTQGTNVSQYVNKLRLSHAAKMLLDSDESVTRIAIKSGFVARSNFYREFQRVYGQSPIEYRNSDRSEEDGGIGNGA